MEFSCSAMIVRLQGSAKTSADVQHLDVLLIGGITCRCVAANFTCSGQEMWKLRVEIHLRLSTSYDCN